jgi:hypothetical protein
MIRPARAALGPAFDMLRGSTMPSHEAKDFQDIIRTQTEYMQTQFGICAEQTKGLTEAFTKAAMSAVKPPKN